MPKGIYIRRAHQQATVTPTTADIGVMAGFYLGEGSVQVGNCSVEIGQAEREPLERVLAWVGGTIRVRTSKYKGERKVYWRWRCSGERARGFLLTIYKFMSPRRKQQIRAVLGRA